MENKNIDNSKLTMCIHKIELGRYQEALSSLFELLSDSPCDEYLLYLTAQCCFNLDKYMEAEDFCIQSLLNGYNLADCNYLLGKIYMFTGELSKAEGSFLEALRFEPERAPILASYGILMLRTGHDKKAKMLMAEAMRLDPENAAVLNYKLMFHIFENSKNHQISTLQKFINSTSSELMKFINLGIYNIHNKNYKAAHENFRQAFLLNPTDKDLLATLEDLDKNCSILFLPHRLISKVGAPVIWLSFMALVIILGFLNLKTLQGVVALVYVSLALYTWIAKFLYDIANKSSLFRTFKR